jgi:general stress protein YciG
MKQCRQHRNANDPARASEAGGKGGESSGGSGRNR